MKKKKNPQSMNQVVQTKKLLILILAAAIILIVAIAALLGGGKSKDAKTIMLDAGHGGDASGIQALLSEDEFDEKVVDELYQLLDSSKDFKVLRTHEAGTAMSVADRIAVINDKEPDLVISIHTNESDNAVKAGAMVLVQTPASQYNQTSIAFAKALQSSFAQYHTDAKINYLFYHPIKDGTVFQENYVDVSQTEVPQEETIDLASCNAPMVQVRHLYATNQSEVDRWNSEQGIKEAAKVYYDALIAYYQE